MGGLTCQRCGGPFTKKPGQGTKPKYCVPCRELNQREAVHDYHVYKYWPKYGFNRKSQCTS